LGAIRIYGFTFRFVLFSWQPPIHLAVHEKESQPLLANSPIGTHSPMQLTSPAAAPSGTLGLSRYQWTVLLAAWLGWGFDVFDGLLFNYVAPNCVTTLLHLTPGTRFASAQTILWTAIVTSILLVGWAIGGVLFGRVCDQIGRMRTLLITIAVYAVGTACCALAPNIWLLLGFRFLAGLGIGGEWAAGASMVAEIVPEERRVEAGALLYTSAPAGLFLATFVNYEIAGVLLKGQPELSWRWVFVTGLAPALLAFAVRLMVNEPERWQVHGARTRPLVSDLFTPENRAQTTSGLIVAVTALIMWWSTNAFIPTIATLLAGQHAHALSLSEAASAALTEHWKFIATSSFNWGGLLGTLLTIPAAKFLGRKPMFAIYFALSAVSLFVTFHMTWPPETILRLYFLNGLTLFGLFGSFTYYLPELYPTRLRATGSGFCYNVGRLVTAAGPILIALMVLRGGSVLDHAFQAQSWIAVVPLVGLCFLPWVIETKGRKLAD
jgi:MFS family permease